MTNDAEVVATELKKSFASSSIESLKYAVTSYTRIDAWMATPAMTESSYNRLLQVLSNAGTYDGNVPFSKVVYNTYAYRVA